MFPDLRLIFKDREGDQLDLKSQLCKYLFLTIKPDDTRYSQGRITCEAEDAQILAAFLQQTV